MPVSAGMKRKSEERLKKRGRMWEEHTQSSNVALETELIEQWTLWFGCYDLEGDGRERWEYRVDG